MLAEEYFDEGRMSCERTFCGGGWKVARLVG